MDGATGATGATGPAGADGADGTDTVAALPPEKLVDGAAWENAQVAPTVTDWRDYHMLQVVFRRESIATDTFYPSGPILVPTLDDEGSAIVPINLNDWVNVVRSPNSDLIAFTLNNFANAPSAGDKIDVWGIQVRRCSGE